MTGRWSEQDRQTIDDAMGLPVIEDHGLSLISIARPRDDDLPHYPSQAERDNAGAAAGLIVIFVFTIGFVVGFAVRAVLA